MFKELAQAIDDIVQMGGRLSDSSFDFVQKLLGEEMDEFQEFAKNFFGNFQEEWRERYDAMENKIDELTDKLAALDKSSATPPPVKKASTTK